ncbi:MAG: hypothetical protein CME63_14760 [Halobacteriovoraceae bacterium]|nr:hypothetical protein [Halobacteriovoraceae bacterium]|tara:strand:- start:47760 stop:48656 length:897 start_codon:yes stop_codon:yes gene_type:complete
MLKVNTKTDLTITVVTNTYKRSTDLVSRSLYSSLKQSDYLEQVILIDQNDPPLNLPQDITNHPKFRRIKSESNCVSVARNSLLKEEIEGWIIFCDDDGYFDDNYLETFVSVVKENPDVRIFAGSIIRDDNFEFYSPRHKIGGDLNKFINTKLLMGSNFSVQSEIFRELNGFDERFGAGSYWGSGEETDFAWKAYFHKIKMKYSPELRVLHIKPYAGDFSSSCDKAFRYGRGKGALVSKWLIFNRKSLVLLELLEMILLPIFQFIKLILRLKIKTSIYPICALTGRIRGFLLALLCKHY